MWRWEYRIIPLAMKGITLKTNPGECVVGDLDASGIHALIEFGMDGQTARGSGAANQVHDDGSARQRAAAPVPGDVTKQTVFDLVPLAGPRREMAHTDDQPGFI